MRSLGNGFQLVKAGSVYYVHSVPGELTMDHTDIIEKAQVRH